jgi:hypothetical protein
MGAIEKAVVGTGKRALLEHSQLYAGGSKTHELDTRVAGVARALQRAGDGMIGFKITFISWATRRL